MAGYESPPGELISPQGSKDDPVEQEAIKRLAEARHWKQRRLLDFKECYFFTAPSRQRQLSSETQPSVQTMLDEPELNTDLGFLLTADFTTEVINAYLPEAQMWCERGPGMDVPDQLFNDQMKVKVRAADKKIFQAIKASNFYAELPKCFTPDLAIGTAGLWIHRPYPTKPIEVLAVPMREIEINLGPNGEIDDRFIVRYPRNALVQAYLGALWDKVDEETKAKIKEQPAGRTELTWGFWRRWDRPEEDECWQHVVLIGKKRLHDIELKGEGSCPFIVIRFGATADWPWAIGPMIQGLPTMRQVDDLERMKIEGVEWAVNPAIKYPDDSVTNIEQGIEPGMGYPVRVGAENAFGPIYNQPSLDPALLELETKEHRLKKLHFTDYPEQSGDTPPTASQWLDELARAQRRIGMAGYSFWREGPLRIFLRYKFLLEIAGTIEKLQDASGKLIATQPINPTQRAAEQQEIATATQAAQIGAQMFPEEWRLVVDGKQTIVNFIQKMRVAYDKKSQTGLIAMRDSKEVAQVAAQLAQLAGTRQKAGGATPEEAGAPAAP
jgi:hypothetical protein